MPQDFSGGTEENHDYQVRMTNNPVENITGHLPNTSLYRCHYVNLLDGTYTHMLYLTTVYNIRLSF